MFISRRGTAVTNQNTSKTRHKFRSPKYQNITLSQPILHNTHSHMGPIYLIRLKTLIYLERQPLVIDKNLVMQINIIVATHHEPAALREVINVRGMGMKIIAFLDILEINKIGRLHVLPVEDDLADGFTVRIELVQRIDHSIGHRFAEPMSLAGAETFTQLDDAALLDVCFLQIILPLGENIFGADMTVSVLSGGFAIPATS